MSGDARRTGKKLSWWATLALVVLGCGALTPTYLWIVGMGASPGYERGLLGCVLGASVLSLAPLVSLMEGP